ncbi:PLP-dependent aminotransferase family protein [Microbacteriaceae bacterium 4G12]
MPKLDYDRKAPLYIQIYHHLKTEIQTGAIGAGTQLPSHRKLAEHLGVSRNTIETAYQQLMAEGYVESKPKKGLFAAKLNYNLIQESHLPPVIPLSKKEDERSQYDFSHGQVDAASFPLSTWRKITTESLLNYENKLFTKEDPQGEYELRQEICRYLYESRGVVSSPDHITIGAGTQSLIWLLVQLIGFKDPYAIENPGFHRVRAIFQSCHTNLTYIPLDDKGIQIDKLYESKAKTVYITPSHQFPTGIIMPLSRRIELLEWAKCTGSYIIEDDYDGEFRYVGKPIPSLQGLDTNSSVVYFGTFSKSFLPSIRMSYMVLPPSLLTKYKQNGLIYKQTASKLHQLTLASFMSKGHWSQHLNRIRTLYKRKQKTLISSIQSIMGEKVDIIGSQSGLHIILHVKNGMSEADLIQTAKQQNVTVYPVSPYYSYTPDNLAHVLLGFGGLTESEIVEAIILLKKAWFAVSSS